MRLINFIKPLPPHRERELRIWYRSALICTVSIVLLCGIVSSIQLYLWGSLYRSKKTMTQQLTQFGTTIAQQKNDRTMQNLLTQQQKRIERYIKDPKNPLHIIAAISAATKDTPLQSINVSADSIELQIHAASPEAVIAVMERLAHAPIESELIFDAIQLASLSYAGNQVNATIKAVPTRGLRIGKYDRTSKS